MENLSPMLFNFSLIILVLIAALVIESLFPVRVARKSEVSE